MSAGFRIELLADHHKRSEFHCGTEPLDRYFREQVTQDIRSRATWCYVAAEADTGKVAGYYTLAASGVTRILCEGRERLFRYAELRPSTPLRADDRTLRTGH